MRWLIMEINIHIIQEHLFWKREDDLCILLDTGSPMSFGNVQIQWRGQEMDLSQKMELLDLKELSDTIHTKVDAILGADLLLEGPMFLTFVEDRIRLGPPQGIGTIPVIDMKIDGQNKKVCIDTGAKQSFLLRALVDEIERIGTVDDFHVTVGVFSTELVRVSVQADGKRFPIEAAVVPPALEHMFDVFGIDAILGLDFLTYFPSLIQNREIFPQPELQTQHDFDSDDSNLLQFD